MSSASRRVVIVGAGLAGFRVAADLRRLGYSGALTLSGAETHAPYDRPPLSKQFLTGDSSTADARLASDEEISDLDLELRLGTAVRSVTPGEVVLADGSSLACDTVVVATGAAAHMPAFVPDHRLIHRLRTLDDALVLREALLAARSLLIVGGGFIGAEVASSARRLGLDVTIVEAMPTLFHHSLGPVAGELCSALHRRNGVRLVTGMPVKRFLDSTDAVSVEMLDHSVVRADVALVGIGTRLNTTVLNGCGLELTEGIPCDDAGRVDGLPGVYAVGDVASWSDEMSGRRIRREHWSSAGDQATIVAHSILGIPVPDYLRTAPYFWSDQYDQKIQLIGRPELAQSGRWLEHDPDDSIAVYGYERGEDLVGVATFGPPRLLAKYRPLVAAGMATATRMTVG